MQAEQHHLFSVLSSEAPNRKKTPEIRFLVFVWVWEWLSSWGRQLMQNVWVLFAAGTKSPLSSLRAGIFYTQSVFRLKTTMKDDANLHHQRVPECVYVCVSVCYEAYIQISKSHAGFVKANDLDRSRLKETKTACCFKFNSPSIPHKFLKKKNLSHLLLFFVEFSTFKSQLCIILFLKKKKNCSVKWICAIDKKQRIRAHHAEKRNSKGPWMATY